MTLYYKGLDVRRKTDKSRESYPKVGDNRRTGLSLFKK